MTPQSNSEDDSFSEINPDDDGFETVKRKCKNVSVPRCIITQSPYKVKTSNKSKPALNPKVSAETSSRRAEDKLADLERRGLIGAKRS